MNGGGGSSAVRRAKTFSLGAQVVIIVPVVRIYHPHFLQIFCSTMKGNFHTREAECRIDDKWTEGSKKRRIQRDRDRNTTNFTRASLHPNGELLKFPLSISVKCLGQKRFFLQSDMSTVLSWPILVWLSLFLLASVFVSGRHLDNHVTSPVIHTAVCNS